MGKTDWSVEQLERDLAASFALLGRMEQGGVLAPGESVALAEGVLRCMNGALVKVSESVEEQALLRRELAAVREETRRQDAGRQARAQALELRIRQLEEEVRLLRDLAELHGRPRQQAPQQEFLERPLVVRTAKGEFLGVSVVSGAPLSTGDFVHLVERGGGGRLVSTLWEARGEDWFLTLGISGRPDRRMRCFDLEIRPVLTPSGNLVAELAGMAEDGAPVPAEFLLQMFRKLRDSLQE